jgi:hypothetical protein
MKLSVDIKHQMVMVQKEFIFYSQNKSFRLITGCFDGCIDLFNSSSALKIFIKNF